MPQFSQNANQVTVLTVSNHVILVVVIICGIFIILLLVLIVYVFYNNKKNQEKYLQQLAEQANKLPEELDETKLQN